MQTKTVRETMYYKGVMLLRCEIVYPDINVCERFFEEIAEKCVLWSKTKLYDELSEKFEKDTDPKKRFTRGYEYKVLLKEKEKIDGYIVMEVLSCVKKRGEKEARLEEKSKFAVRVSDGSLIPESAMRKLKKRHNKQKKVLRTVANDKKQNPLLKKI